MTIAKWFGFLPRIKALEAEVKTLEVEVSALRESNASLSQEKFLLQDRLDAAMDERTRLWQMFDDTLKSERTAYQAHINQSWQRQGAGVPYPDAPHIPPQSIPTAEPGGAGRQGRRTMSEQVAAKTNQFMHEYAEQLEQLRGK